jgi:N-acetylneuraminate synthase
MAKKGKPVFLSTGAATVGEIEQAVETVRTAGNEQICLLHCVLAYPTAYADANLRMIEHLARIFPGYLLGYSDHTRPDEAMLTVTAAYLYGAKVLEKHFTLDKSLPGNDHYHAMDPSDLARLRRNIELVELTAGHQDKRPLECEAESRKQARRSIVAARDIEVGVEITAEMLTFKRPGTGITPALVGQIIGRTARRDIAADTLIDWADI